MSSAQGAPQGAAAGTGSDLVGISVQPPLIVQPPLWVEAPSSEADQDVELHQEVEHHHRAAQSGWARAAVFGVSDGLVTNVSLILGVAGAQPGASYVRLAGLAGLLAG